MRSLTFAGLALLLSVSTAAAEEAAEPADPALIAVTPKDFKDKRVVVEMTIMSPSVNPPGFVGCSKDTVPYLLGPKRDERGGYPMLKGEWAVCVPKAELPEIVKLPSGTALRIEGNFNIKGSKVYPRYALRDAVIEVLGG